MGKAFRDIEHLFVLGGKGHTHPLAKGFAVGAAVHGNVVHFAHGHTHQLALGMVLLEMQAAQHALGGAALVILYKGLVNPGGGEIVDLISLHKITAVIAKHGRFDHNNAGDFGFNKIKLTHFFIFSFYRSGFARRIT